MRATKVHTNGTREHGRTGTNQLRRSQLKGIGSAIRHDASRGRSTLSGDARLEEKQLKDKGIEFLERQRMMDPATWCVSYEEEGEAGQAGEGEECGGEGEGAGEEGEAEAGSEGGGGGGGGGGGAGAGAGGGGGGGGGDGAEAAVAEGRPLGGVTTSQGVRSAVSGAALQELLSKAKAGNNLRVGSKVLVSVSSDF